MFELDRLDHLVLTVADLDATLGFYTRALGMRAVAFGEGRRALVFGRRKINLHPAGGSSSPRRPPPCRARRTCVLSPGPRWRR